MGDVFLDNDSIISSTLSIGQETRLSMTDQSREMLLQTMSYDFGNDLILSITQPNRSEVPEVNGIPTLRD